MGVGRIVRIKLLVGLFLCEVDLIAVQIYQTTNLTMKNIETMCFYPLLMGQENLTLATESGRGTTLFLMTQSLLVGRYV